MDHRRLRPWILVGALGACVAAWAEGAGVQTVTFDADEVARILALGPWPPPPGRDPTNRVSGVPEAIALGRHLFFYPRFSPSGYVSGAACHQPDRAFTDSLPRARGLAPVDRNAIALQNLRLQRWYGWGGSSDSLWMASLRPILDPREIGSLGREGRLRHPHRRWRRVPLSRRVRHGPGG